MTSREYRGFTVFPLQFSLASSSCHQLFLKENSTKIREGTKPSGQTLFIVNIPPYVTEKSIEHVFSSVGKVVSVILEKTEQKNDGFQKAFVIFSKRQSLLKVLKLAALNTLSSKKEPLEIGLEKWVKAYNFSICDSNILQKNINNFMSSYEQEQKEKSKEEIVDDEGWTLITKGGRKPGLSRKESIKNKLNNKALQGWKRKELKNFYTFQMKESRMKNIATLRKKFEEAKSKVKLMKQARKFKPY